MHHFSVWAPRVRSCSALVDGKVHPMTLARHDWWHAEVAEACYGADYQFLLDADPTPYPDPRSSWQPCGVHGASRVLDHSRYEWTDHGWSPQPLSRGVIYELHVGTFTSEGTFAAAIEKLPALRALGVTHVELMPVNSFPGRWGWGYDGVAIFAPQEQYGGPEGLKLLVDACHQHGMAVLLDVVYNHFGPVGNYTGRFAPYMTEQHHTPWGGAINFEGPRSVEVRRFFCDNALMWLRDYHFDGLRLDAIHAFVDRSTKHFLEQLSEEVEELGKKISRDLVLIAESDLNDPRVVTPRGSQVEGGPRSLGGYGIDAQWSDDFHHSIVALLTGERNTYYRDFGAISQVAKALRSAYVFDGEYSPYRGRNHGRPVKELSAHRFLGYIQNHDQVGNRAYGDRIHAVAGLSKAKLAAALLITSPFVPMLFQGEEFAASSPFLYFADHDDPEIARAVSEGRRREHAPDGEWDSVPNPESRESFEASKLNWSERKEGHHAEMLDWYRRLIELRTTNASLLDGCLQNIKVDFDEREQWLSMERGSFQMVFNFGSKSVSLPMARESRLVLTSDPAVAWEANFLVLPPVAFAALQSTS